MYDYTSDPEAYEEAEQKHFDILEAEITGN